MTTKHRFQNNKYRLEVRERDHNPPHVHLFGGGIDVIIDLTTFATEGTLPKNLRNEVLTWIANNQDELFKEWQKWHP